MKVEFLQNPNGPSQKLNLPILEVKTNDISSFNAALQPVIPRTDIQSLNDREIATGYLLTLKRSGREYAWAAMETTHPQLREFLKDAFTMCCNHAYGIWEWMAKKGYYACDTAPQSSINNIGSFYKEVKQPALV